MTTPSQMEPLIPTTDQGKLDFMGSLLELEGFQNRTQPYVERRVGFKSLKPEAAYLLKEVLHPEGVEL